MEMSEKESFPAPTPTHKLSTTSVMWNISIGQLGLAAWLCSLPAPAHLLVSSILENWKKSLISQRQLKTSVLSTFFSYYIQNTATAGGKINYIAAKTRTSDQLCALPIYRAPPPSQSVCLEDQKGNREGLDAV